MSLAGREQRVVLALANEVSGFEVGAALPDDDRAGFGELTAVQLHAEVLRVGVPTVAS